MREKFVHREVNANLAEQESWELLGGRKAKLLSGSTALARAAVKRVEFPGGALLIKNPGINWVIVE
jgi:hypothetical protein